MSVLHPPANLSAEVVPHVPAVAIRRAIVNRGDLHPRHHLDVETILRHRLGTGEDDGVVDADHRPQGPFARVSGNERIEGDVQRERVPHRSSWKR